MQKTTMALAAALFAAGCASDGDHAVDTEQTSASVDVEELLESDFDVDFDLEIAPAAPDRAARQFEMLKTLEGAWVASGAEGSMPDTEINYEISSAGSAVVETIFPGAEHQMVSVYHMDNGRLVMTHYCAMGNQPFMTSLAGTDDGVIKFMCTRVGNAATHADAHMHEGVFTIGGGTLHTEWTMYEDLQRGGTVVIDLVRGDM